MNEPIRGPWPKRPISEFKPYSPLDWFNRRAPGHDWMVDGCFLRGTVAMLSGDGGLGKSLLMQQLQTAAALGRDWLGLATKPCRSLAMYCEDDRDELHRRQEAICRHYGCEMDQLEGVHIVDRAGGDSVMMQFGRWGDGGTRTSLFEQVSHAAREIGAELVILDPVADIFSGNEIDRNQPRTFIRELRKLALAIQGCVILTQHPSVDGMREGSGRSGSTGWNNSVRSRLYLTHAKKRAGEDEPPPNERLLRTMKANQGPAGGKIPLIWREGVFVRNDPPRPRDWSEPEGWPD